MTAKLEKQGDEEYLVIELPVHARPSKSGKTTVIASTNGNIESGVEYDGKPVRIGVNAYLK